MKEAMKLSGESVSFSKYGKSFQEKLCMVILDDRPFADQIEEVLDVNFLELNYLKLFLNKIFDYRKKYEVHPSRDIMKTILRSDLDNENELTTKQVREFYVRSQVTDVSDVAGFLPQAETKRGDGKVHRAPAEFVLRRNLDSY